MTISPFTTTQEATDAINGANVTLVVDRDDGIYRIDLINNYNLTIDCAGSSVSNVRTTAVTWATNIVESESA